MTPQKLYYRIELRFIPRGSATPVVGSLDDQRLEARKQLLAPPRVVVRWVSPEFRLWIRTIFPRLPQPRVHREQHLWGTRLRSGSLPPALRMPGIPLKAREGRARRWRRR